MILAWPSLACSCPAQKILHGEEDWPACMATSAPDILPPWQPGSQHKRLIAAPLTPPKFWREWSEGGRRHLLRQKIARLTDFAEGQSFAVGRE